MPDSWYPLTPRTPPQDHLLIASVNTSLLLLHSPLVGPSSWEPAARELLARGHQVAAPDLTVVASARPPRWQAYVDTAVEAAAHLPGPVAVVGHSGAGAFLPAIGERLGGRHGSLLFVDAVLPPRTGMHTTSAALQALLDDQTVGGSLRRWLEWWPDEEVERLLPEAADRAVLLSDMPRLPRSFYDEAVPVPDGWSEGACTYLKLSVAYQAEFVEAGRRGWPRRELAANHLTTFTDPVRTVDAIAASLADPEVFRS